MRNPYLKRTIEPLVRQAIREFPAVVLTGPRQSGKTTLLKHLFGAKYRYVSVEPPDVRMAATEDPRGFIEMYPPPVIFDEIQYAPELLPYIKEKIDAERHNYGQYLITGSQNLLLMEKVTESLAGRAAMLRLLPLTMREKEGLPQKRLPWELKGHRHKEKKPSLKKLWGGFLRGGYPELTAHPLRDASLWHSAYIQTYLERDVKMIRWGQAAGKNQPRPAHLEGVSPKRLKATGIILIFLTLIVVGYSIINFDELTGIDDSRYRKRGYAAALNSDARNAYTAVQAYLVDNPKAGAVTCADMEKTGYKPSYEDVHCISDMTKSSGGITITGPERWGLKNPKAVITHSGELSAAQP